MYRVKMRIRIGVISESFMCLRGPVNHYFAEVVMHTLLQLKGENVVKIW